jgi:hypothetical protein
LTMDELLTWLLADDLGRDKLALLMLCVLAMSVLAAQLRWRLRARAGQRKDAAGPTWTGRWLAETIRVLYCVGIPLGVLWRGALVREMGLPVTLVGPTYLLAGDGASAWSWTARLLAWLQYTDAQPRVQLGAGLAAGLGAMLALIAVWVWYGRTVMLPSGLAHHIPFAVPWWTALRQALMSQFLWALYRGFVASLVPNRTQAAVFALALISIPWALDPSRRRDLLSARGYLVVQEWLLALFTVLVSLVANLLWFLILMHTLWVWVGARLLAHLSERSGQAPSILAAS